MTQNYTIADPSRAPGCLVTPSTDDASFDVVFNSALSSTATCISANDTHVTTVKGRTSSLVSVAVVADQTSDTVNITLAGPSDAWYAVGFNAEVMTDLPWTVVVSAGSTDADPPVITERSLGDHAPGKQLKPHVELVSNNVENGLRTVVVSRSLKGVDADRYSFSPSGLASSTLNYISAVGATRSFDGNKHKTSASASIAFIGTHTNGGTLDTCVCRGSTGTIGIKGGSSYVFDQQCMDEPLSDLMKDKNPTCDLNSYRGGLYCCKDGFFVLDEDQEIPPAVDEVRLLRSIPKPQIATAVCGDRYNCTID